MDKKKLTEHAVLPARPEPHWKANGSFSVDQLDALAREAWTMGLDYGMAHAPAADETTLPDLMHLLNFASKEERAVKLSPIAAGTLYNAMASVPVQPVEVAPSVWSEAWHALRDDVLSGVDGLDNDQVNTILGMLDNYEPAAPAAGSAT